MLQNVNNQKIEAIKQTLIL